MYILSSEQMREADQFTISNKPIDSVELMESAAMACVKEITDSFTKTSIFHIFCGPGNNGGDGLAIARLLKVRGYDVKVTLLNVTGKLSHDNNINLLRAKSNNLNINVINKVPDDFLFGENSILIDALFGIGLNQPPEGEYKKLIEIINNSGRHVISIDMPSGLFADQSSIADHHPIVKADETYTFQYLKAGLLMPENATYFGKVTLLDIGLLPEATSKMSIPNRMLDEKIIKHILQPRPVFSHKGTFGHGLLIAGSDGKMGACVLSTGAFLRSGAGLLTVMVPDGQSPVIKTSWPEAMTTMRSTLTGGSLSMFNALGIGPGLGTDQAASGLLYNLLAAWRKPVVLDADALNILAENKSWIQQIPAESILTPHPGEFKRLFGAWKNDFEKIAIQKQAAIELKCIVILKGKNTSIALSDGRIFFNPTGNSGMAKGGSGDVLTGLITGLLSSGYNPESATCLGVYLHGCAGDLAAAAKSEEGMTAADIIDFIPQAWKKIHCY
jgi:hydroxyethylthiazole kinase-like uncharacterized protein yjeF